MPESKLDAVGWREFAEVYRSLIKVGITPTDADELELWQIGALVQSDLDHTDGISIDQWERERDTLAERAQRIAEMSGKPIPEPSEVVDITSMVKSADGIR